MTTLSFASLAPASTWSGTPAEVGRQLATAEDDQVVAMTLPHTSAEVAEAVANALPKLLPVLGQAMDEHDTQALKALAEALPKFLPMLSQAVARRDAQVLKALADAIAGLIPVRESALRDAEMLAAAQSAALTSAEWLTAAQLAEHHGFSKTNPSAQPNKWKTEQLIFAVRRLGLDYFPRYGLNENLRPLEGFAEVVKILSKTRDAWGMAYWFASANGFLGGRRPQDVVGSELPLVIKAAEDEDMGILHG